jgi:hypothetical protein
MTLCHVSTSECTIDEFRGADPVLPYFTRDGHHNIQRTPWLVAKRRRAFRASPYDVGNTGWRTGGNDLPSAREASDGKVWFITSESVYWIDPKKVQRNSLKPPVIITSVRASGKHYLAGADVRVPAGTPNFEVDYTALSLSMRVECNSNTNSKGWALTGRTPAPADRLSTQICRRDNVRFMYLPLTKTGFGTM